MGNQESFAHVCIINETLNSRMRAEPKEIVVFESLRVLEEANFKFPGASARARAAKLIVCMFAIRGKVCLFCLHPLAFSDWVGMHCIIAGSGERKT